MCQAFHDLRSNNVVTGSSLILYLVFAFSAIQGPVKELRLSFMSGEKYLNKNISTFFRV